MCVCVFRFEFFFFFFLKRKSWQTISLFFSIRIELTLRLHLGASGSFSVRQLILSGKCHYINPSLGREAGGIFGEVGVNVRLQPH